MYYAEVLYARSRLFWFTLIALLVAAVFTYFVTFPPPHAHIRNNGQDVPIDIVLTFAGFFATIMASMVAATMNRDGTHLPYMWTKPVTRARIALSYIAIDVLAILAAYAVVVVVCVLVLSIPPRNPILFDALTIPMLARTLAVPFMLYGVIEIATSWSPTRLGAAGGLVWPIGFAVLFLGELNLPFPLTPIFYVLNVFNPMAYFPETHFHGHLDISGSTALPFDFTGQTIVAFCIFVVSCAIATYNWKRMQA
ncbi:MAG TPA: hypothetical protein VGG22_10645 [Candidatus Baltobacteraceae bacterium]|jgi:ABC-type transport system involved in multi-copper enzyme maturation permease subunit